jgi:MazG family protein
MVRRHPHVFASDPADTPEKVLRNWEALKQQERLAKGHQSESLLDGVSKALPATVEAFQMTTKAGRVGFDWPDEQAVLAKLDEETAELKAALAAPERDPARVADELGDLMFVAVNLARKLGLDAESTLKQANRKFRRRFRYVEQRLRERGRSPAESKLEEMDELWDEAKAALLREA